MKSSALSCVKNCEDDDDESQQKKEKEIAIVKKTLRVILFFVLIGKGSECIYIYMKF